jgi:hypothetical protein
LNECEYIKKKRWKPIKSNAQGGLGKRKAEQDRLIFMRSTRNRIFLVNVRFYRNMRVGIDSS